MENNIKNKDYIISDIVHRDYFDKQIHIIKRASEIAQAKMDYFSAHDEHVMHSIQVIQDFLRKKHRLCYGGQAINAHLPAKYKFYNPEYSIPDYDFFTPSQHTDINMIVNELKKAGFTEISVREGMHEGTIKIYVDYIPVADITSIDPKLYRILSAREYRLDGISYLDANTLRMLMYLEMSRPRGEVSRWTKIYERLLLFNEFIPVKTCKKHDIKLKNGLERKQIEYVFKFIIERKHIFAGAHLLDFYEYALKKNKSNINKILTSKKPIIFFSPEPDVDAKYIVSELKYLSGPKSGTIRIKTYSSNGIDLIPSITILYKGKSPLIFLINQSACHSYFNIPFIDSTVLRIASMDTLITLYFGLGLIKSTFFDIGSMECIANLLVDISTNARIRADKFMFPFISIKCSGHQTSLPSLIRAKVQRITLKKRDMNHFVVNKISTKRRTIR